MNADWFAADDDEHAQCMGVCLCVFRRSETMAYILYRTEVIVSNVDSAGGRCQCQLRTPDTVVENYSKECVVKTKRLCFLIEAMPEQKHHFRFA